MDDKVSRLKDALIELLSPFGWHVWWTRPPIGIRGYHMDDPYDFHFELRPADGWLKGITFRNRYSLSGLEVQYQSRNADYWDHLPLMIARRVMDQLTAKIDKARRTPPAELDWRPTETIPEDFYSM